MPDDATEGVAEHSSRLQPSINLHAINDRVITRLQGISKFSNPDVLPVNCSRGWFPPRASPNSFPDPPDPCPIGRKPYEEPVVEKTYKQLLLHVLNREERDAGIK